MESNEDYEYEVSNHSALHSARVEGVVKLVNTATAGRGLISRIDLQPGDLIFVAPTIRVPKEQYCQHAKKTVFEDYLFHGRSGDYHLCLHLGSIFNHSAAPNVLWTLEEHGLESEEGMHGNITFRAFKRIAKGEEMSISYGAWGQQYEEGSVGALNEEDTREGEESSDEESPSVLFKL